MMEYNNIVGNGEGIYNATQDEIPSLRRNWWGDESGPWHQGVNPLGTGDSLSFYAWDCAPWLTEPVGGVTERLAVGVRTASRGGLGVRVWPNPVRSGR